MHCIWLLGQHVATLHMHALLHYILHQNVFMVGLVILGFKLCTGAVGNTLLVLYCFVQLKDQLQVIQKQHVAAQERESKLQNELRNSQKQVI